MSRRLQYLASLLIVAALWLSACNPIVAPAPVAPAPVTEAAAPTEVAVEEPAAPAAEAGDLVSVVHEYMSNIPEGFMSVGKLEAFKTILETGAATIVDVRETSEYEAGHVPGAISIPLRTLAQNLALIPTDMPVVVYCASGHRAAMATSSLRILGYSNVRAFPGGWKAWSDGGEEASMDAVEGEAYDMPEITPEVLAAVDGFLSGIPEGWLALGAVDKLEGAIDAGATLIDVREESEYAEGAILDAVNIPIRTLIQNLDQIPADSPVVVYCASGFRAGLSLASLQILGYSNVRSFPPGYGGWEASVQ